MNGKRIWPERRECYTVRRVNVFTGTETEEAGILETESLVVFAEQDGCGEDGGPEAAFVPHS
jgi:hypothetical protein